MKKAQMRTHRRSAAGYAVYCVLLLYHGILFLTKGRNILDAIAALSAASQMAD